MYQEADILEDNGHPGINLPAGFPCPVGFLLAKTHAGLRAAVDAELVAHGLTIVQFSLLSMLAANPGKSSAELSRVFCVSPQAMAPLVARLETEGYLRRSPHPVHRRVIECWITPAGESVLDATRPVIARLEAETLGAELSPEEVKTLEALLYRLLVQIRARNGGRPAVPEEFPCVGESPE